MNILVTGENGMVGTALVNNLKISEMERIKPDQIFLLTKFSSMTLEIRQKN